MNEYPILTNLPQLVRDAVAYYWTTRNSQQNRQTQVGRSDREPVKVREPHFDVFSEFKNASYAKRYELFCRKLVRERHYTASAFITSQITAEIDGSYHEPARDLTISGFARSIVSHIAAYT